MATVPSSAGKALKLVGATRTFDGASVRATGHIMQVDDAPDGPVNQRYEYAVETVSLWDIGSGLTPVFSAKVNYDRFLDIPVKLLGDYSKNDACVKLAWEISDVPSGAPYYFCLYRKLPGDDTFEYITDIPSERKYYVDPRLNPGETAEYYICIQFEDGRQSGQSNIMTVSAPRKEATPPVTQP